MFFTLICLESQQKDTTFPQDIYTSQLRIIYKYTFFNTSDRKKHWLVYNYIETKALSK